MNKSHILFSVITFTGMIVWIYNHIKVDPSQDLVCMKTFGMSVIYCSEETSPLESGTPDNTPICKCLLYMKKTY